MILTWLRKVQLRSSLIENYLSFSFFSFSSTKWRHVIALMELARHLRLWRQVPCLNGTIFWRLHDFARMDRPHLAALHQGSEGAWLAASATELPRHYSCTTGWHACITSLAMLAVLAGTLTSLCLVHLHVYAHFHACWCCSTSSGVLATVALLTCYICITSLAKLALTGSRCSHTSTPDRLREKLQQRGSPNHWTISLPFFSFISSSSSSPPFFFFFFFFFSFFFFSPLFFFSSLFSLSPSPSN